MNVKHLFCNAFLLKQLILFTTLGFFFGQRLLNPLLPMLPTNVRRTEEERSRLPLYQELELSQKMEIQAERLALLTRECKKEHTIENKEEKLAIVRLRSLVVEKYRVSNCVVYKAGSTAWHGLLIKLLHYNIGKAKIYMMGEILKPSLARFQKVVADPDFLRFVVARNPFSRFLSGYRDRILDISHVTGQARGHVPRILNYTRGIQYSKEELFYPNGSVRIIPSFKEFTQFITSLPPADINYHWRPVYKMCEPCLINYTAVVHVETYNSDINYILRKSGMDKDVNINDLGIYPHKGKGNTDELLISYYSTLGAEIMQKFLNLYARDFKMFGYDPSDILKQIFPNGDVFWN